MSEKDKHINGPVNVVRMEGTVFDIKKVLYVFMDHHSPIQIQTQCDDPVSDDIKKYMAENFMQIEKQKNGKMYDLFYEIYPTSLSKKFTKYRARYIDEVFRLFQNEFNYDEKNDKVLPSKNFSHVRFHYIDIRDYFYSVIQVLLNDLVNLSITIFKSMSIYPNEINVIDQKLQFLQNEMIFLYDNIYSEGKYKPKKQKGGARALAPITDKTYEPVLKNFIDKMMNRYNHLEVKKVLNDFTNDHLKYGFDKILDAITDLRGELPGIFESINIPYDKLTLKSGILSKETYSWGPNFRSTLIYIFDLYDKISSIDNSILWLFARLMDVYFLRRFLDKDYITNGITYTGILHSMTYVYILGKFFDFDVTNFSYSSEKNIKQINKKIRDMTPNDFTEELILPKLFYPATLFQCSDLTGFPEHFN